MFRFVALVVLALFLALITSPVLMHVALILTTLYVR